MPGRFMTWRRVVAIVLILLFTAIPYLRLNGKPLILLDLPARRFTFFGMTFLPTDTLLLALFLVIVFVAVFLVTALFGRIWCGWACPQTVYMEFVFRPIERFFEGTPGRRQRWRFQGTPVAKVVKHAVFFLVACYLAHTFLAYFVGVDQLATWVRRSPLEHPASFLVMLSVTGLMLFDFGFFREQTCIVACPYGRLQSVMLDRGSLIITYDGARGEPRGPMKRTRAPQAEPPVSSTPVPLTISASRIGDCVDCGMCTVCCPTGIDIRDGLQLECIGCAQCIDACDAVMTKLHRPAGLIRYSSQAAIEGGHWRLFRPRVLLYVLLLAALMTTFVVVLSGRRSFDLTVLRGIGQTFFELPDGSIANTVQVKLVNRTATTGVYTLSVTGAEGLQLVIPENPVTVAPGEMVTIKGSIALPADGFIGGQREVKVTVADSEGVEKSRPFRLMGAASRRGAANQAQRDNGSVPASRDASESPTTRVDHGGDR